VADEPESIAARRRAWLTRRTREEWEAVVETMAGEPGPARADLAAAMADPATEEIFAAGGLTPALWPEVRAVLPDDVAAGRDLDDLLVCEIPQDQVNAVCGIYEDGSALVVVSDGLLTLVSHLSQLASYCLHSTGTPLGWARVARTLLRNRKGELTPRQEVVAALLRYHLIQQRCFGVRGKVGVRLDDRAQTQAAVFGYYAVAFVLAHEAGHFALGHPPAALATVDGADLPASSDDPHIELEADAYGFGALARDAAGLPGIDGSTVAAVGAAVALLAIELTEHALFVRLPRTHPPVGERWEGLAAVLGDEAAGTAREMVEMLRRPVLAAIDAPAIPAERWDRVWARRDVPVISHSAEARAYTPALDLALHGPSPEPAQLGRLDPAMEALAERAGAVEGPDGLRRFLEEAGVAGEAVTDALDPRIGLTFHTLLGWLEASTALRALPQREARLLVGCHLARTLAPHVAAVGA
jgi:hypothetical protein